MNFEDYKIIKELGTNSKRKFNRVFLVQDKINSHFSILKHLKKTSNNDYLQELLRNEASYSFQCDNLPKTLHVFENQEELLVFKNYFEGINLADYWISIPKNKRLAFLKKFIFQLLPIFDELKEKGIIHGDIKPSNFIIDGNLDNFEVYLIDFGLSFRVNELQNRKIIFPLGFAAPELILNKLHLANQATDIFALGITIYYLYNGKLPLSHANPAIMTNLQLTYPIQKSNLIPANVFGIVEKMCQKEAFMKPANLLSKEEIETNLKNGIQKRYQDLREVLEAFENIDTKEKKSVFRRLIKIFSNS